MSLATLPCAILQTHFSFSGYSKSGRFFRDGLYLAVCFEAFFSFRRLVRENWRIPGAFARMPSSTIWKTVSPTKKLEARAWLAAALPHTGGLPAKIFVRVNCFATSFFNWRHGRCSEPSGRWDLFCSNERRQNGSPVIVVGSNGLRDNRESLQQRDRVQNLRKIMHFALRMV
jgi:hypothetical protein